MSIKRLVRLPPGWTDPARVERQHIQYDPNLSDSVIMPIAGIIITLVLCYELISMLTERNNMHDIDT